MCKYFSCLLGHCLWVGNGDLDFDTGFQVHRCDLFDQFTWWMQIDDALVHTHLETIPGLTTLTARSFTCGDTEHLGWQTNWSLQRWWRYKKISLASGAGVNYTWCWGSGTYLNWEIQSLGARNQVGAHLLQWTHIGRGQCDTDAMHWGDIGFWFFQILSDNSGSRLQRNAQIKIRYNETNFTGKFEIFLKHMYICSDVIRGIYECVFAIHIAIMRLGAPTSRMCRVK